VAGDGAKRQDVHLVVVAQGRRIRWNCEVHDRQGCSPGHVQGEHVNRGEGLHAQPGRAWYDQDGRSPEDRRGREANTDYHDINDYNSAACYDDDYDNAALSTGPRLVLV
jgi:hypothetical protein